MKPIHRALYGQHTTRIQMHLYTHTRKNYKDTHITHVHIVHVEHSAGTLIKTSIYSHTLAHTVAFVRYTHSWNHTYTYTLSHTHTNQQTHTHTHLTDHLVLAEVYRGRSDKIINYSLSPLLLSSLRPSSTPSFPRLASFHTLNCKEESVIFVWLCCTQNNLLDLSCLVV